MNTDGHGFLQKSGVCLERKPDDAQMQKVPDGKQTFPSLQSIQYIRPQKSNFLSVNVTYRCDPNVRAKPNWNDTLIVPALGRSESGTLWRLGQ